MRKLLLVTSGTLLAIAATAAPALADPVNVTENGGCYDASINGGKNLLFNGVCYLGPPPITIP